MLVTPASALDVMEWSAARRAHGSPLPGRVYKCLLAQAVVSEAVTVRETAGASPLIVGCLDLEAGSASEIWFLEPSGGLSRRLVVRLHRFASRWIAEAAATRPAGLVAHVRTEEGRRLVATLGFVPGGAAGEGWERWRRGHDQGRRESG